MGTSLDRQADRAIRGLKGACALSLDFQAGFSGWRDRRFYPLKRVADESGGGREVVPAPMVWPIAGGAGGEVWGRREQAAARERRRRVSTALGSCLPYHPRTLFPLPSFDAGCRVAFGLSTDVADDKYSAG